MQGKVKRKLRQQAFAASQQRSGGERDDVCALCSRPLGSRVEWHHVVPKSRGGVVTVPVHPICHRAIHAHLTNKELAGEYADLDALRSREDIGRFLSWVAGKPPEFNAPTRNKRI